MSTDARRSFFPEIEPLDSSRPQVFDLHSIYYEESGSELVSETDRFAGKQERSAPRVSDYVLP